MPREAAAQITRSVLKVGETPQVKSSLDKTTWQDVANVDNVANVVSVVMSPSYTDEILSGRNGGYWRFASSDKIQELLDLGKPDQYGRLYFKIVREGEGRGFYLIDRNEWERTTPKDSLTLHVPSIKEAIKEGRPLAVDGCSGDFRDGYRLNVDGVYFSNSAARVAQLETGSETQIPANLLRKAKDQVVALRVKTKPEALDAIEDVLGRL